jgi:hypothetical protein
MGTPVRHDALTPSDLQYYAPRKSRLGASDPSIEPSVNTETSQNQQTSGDFKSSKDSAPVIAPLQDYFQPSGEDSDQHEHRSRPAGHPRIKVLAMIGGAAVVGVLVGIGILGVIQGQDEHPPAKVADVPLATRLQTATSDLQKVTQVVVAPLLVVSETSGDMNVPLPLGLEVKNYMADAIINLSDLPAGTTLSTGNATGNGQWRIAVNDLPKTRVIPPTDYVGLMTLMAQVTVGNGQAVVRSPVRLTWRKIPAPQDKIVGLRQPGADLPVVANAEAPAAPKKIETPVVPGKTEAPVAPRKTETPAVPGKTEPAIAQRTIGANEASALLRRADELMAIGDLAAARLLLQRVAETKNAQAALRLASTYDPLVIKKFANNSIAADPALAQFWYERARDWGSPDASSPLEALASQNATK